MNVDSLRKMHAPRMDSVYNGADDDGSGTVSVLEIAQKFASERPKPQRSILFVWHTGEEPDSSARAGSPIIRRCRATPSSRSSTST